MLPSAKSLGGDGLFERQLAGRRCWLRCSSEKRGVGCGGVGGEKAVTTKSRSTSWIKLEIFGKRRRHLPGAAALISQC